MLLITTRFQNVLQILDKKELSPEDKILVFFSDSDKVDIYTHLKLCEASGVANLSYYKATEKEESICLGLFLAQLEQKGEIGDKNTLLLHNKNIVVPSLISETYHLTVKYAADTPATKRTRKQKAGSDGDKVSQKTGRKKRTKQETYPGPEPEQEPQEDPIMPKPIEEEVDMDMPGFSDVDLKEIFAGIEFPFGKLAFAKIHGSDMFGFRLLELLGSVETEDDFSYKLPLTFSENDATTIKSVIGDRLEMLQKKAVAYKEK